MKNKHTKRLFAGFNRKTGTKILQKPIERIKTQFNAFKITEFELEAEGKIISGEFTRMFRLPSIPKSVEVECFFDFTPLDKMNFKTEPLYKEDMKAFLKH